MPDQDRDRTPRAAGRSADTARTATDAGADAVRRGAEKLQGQVDTALDTAGRASQEAARRTGENLELMKRLAETMASGAREATSEIAEWTRQASERQREAISQFTQAHGLDEVLDIQNRYVRENLQALLDFSAKVSRLSAEKASEASGHLEQDRR